MTTLRTPAWARCLAGALTVAYGGGVLAYWLQEGTSLVALGLALLLLVCAAGLADFLVTRLELQAQALVIHSLTGAKAIPRRQIASVTWERGVGAYVKSTDGGGMKLPYVGNSQACVNTVRAWLKKMP